MGIEGADELVDAEPDLTALATHLETENIAFVDGLNADIAGLVETSADLEYDFVLGDVTGYGVSANGHGHFDLVHDGSSVHCVVFASRLDRLDTDIENDTLVAVNGDLSYYEDEGSVSLIVRSLVDIGEGSYRQVYEENKQALAGDGLLAEEAKQPLPTYPHRIGIVTSADSDARKDAITSIHDRHPDVDIVVQDTSVQGEQAMLSMMDAISTLDDDATVDVIVLTRGGGADKHLRVFNGTPLCRIIHETSTPIVVGVGHENDRTLADDVADRRVMTPTEVGEIVPRKDELKADIESLAEDLTNAYTRAVSTELETARNELDAAYESTVTDDLRALGTQLETAYETYVDDRLTDYRTRLEHAYEKLDQQKTYEAEKDDAVQSYRETTHRQRVIIAALLVGLLVALGYILLTL